MKISPITLMMAVVLTCGLPAFGAMVGMGFYELARVVFP